jgi:hypothetical protein
MPPHPSPLADSVATLRIATLATPAQAWLPAAIHALILACLARVLGRLEDMIRLWQAGLLPPPRERQRTVRTNLADPRPREARQDSISVARPPSRTAGRAAADARSHMETAGQGDASRNLSVCVSSSLPRHAPDPPARPAPRRSPGHQASCTPSASPINCSPGTALLENDLPTSVPNHALNVTMTKQKQDTIQGQGHR